MENDLVSVIMPSYNTAQYIKKSIESVLSQTYQKWELIIVDDCSSDNTTEIVKSISDSRIHYYVNKVNCGAAITRNIALKKAKGRWVAFLDSDDIWLPTKLEHQIQFMEKAGYVFSYHEYIKIDENDKKMNVRCSGPDIVTKRKMYHYGYPGCLSVMYDQTQIGLVQICDIKKNNDYAIWLIVCKKADCYLLKESLAEYRIRTKSISHDKLSKKLKSHYDLFKMCDKKNSLQSLWYASWNLFWGILKKIKYEKKYIS